MGVTRVRQRRQLGRRLRPIGGGGNEREQLATRIGIETMQHPVVRADVQHGGFALLGCHVGRIAAPPSSQHGEAEILLLHEQRIGVDDIAQQPGPVTKWPALIDFPGLRAAQPLQPLLPHRVCATVIQGVTLSLAEQIPASRHEANRLAARPGNDIAIGRCRNAIIGRPRQGSNLPAGIHRVGEQLAGPVGTVELCLVDEGAGIQACRVGCHCRCGPCIGNDAVQGNLDGGGDLGGSLRVQHLPATIDGGVPQVIHGARAASGEAAPPSGRSGVGVDLRICIRVEQNALAAQRDPVSQHMQVTLAIGPRWRAGRFARGGHPYTPGRKVGTGAQGAVVILHGDIGHGIAHGVRIGLALVAIGVASTRARRRTVAEAIGKQDGRIGLTGELDRSVGVRSHQLFTGMGERLTVRRAAADGWRQYRRKETVALGRHGKIVHGQCGAVVNAEGACPNRGHVFEGRGHPTPSRQLALAVITEPVGEILDGGLVLGRIGKVAGLYLVQIQIRRTGARREAASLRSGAITIGCGKQLTGVERRWKIADGVARIAADGLLPGDGRERYHPACCQRSPRATQMNLRPERNGHSLVQPEQVVRFGAFHIGRQVERHRAGTPGIGLGRCGRHIGKGSTRYRRPGCIGLARVEICLVVLDRPEKSIGGQWRNGIVVITGVWIYTPAGPGIAAVRKKVGKLLPRTISVTRVVEVQPGTTDKTIC
ncbi:hypothetical protein D3C84_174880 [compost metagenome]